jgi:glycosyltransferase involved in cell wall biosynthesis
LFSTTTAAMLARGHGLPYAVRLDSPAALNRPGARNAPVRRLERRSLARARLIIPIGAAGAAALPAGSAPAEVVPVPIEPSGDTEGPRDRDLAVGYASDMAKGLDLLCAAWAQVGGSGRLEIFGVERDAALAFLRRRNLPEPPRTRFRGIVAADAFRATLRRARCFISAARWEDFGQAPLEALRDGALLVTTPARGPYEALAIGRELDPGLVAPDLDPASLATAIRAAWALDDGAHAEYRARAAPLLEPYRRRSALAALSERVLPVLLAPR